MPEIEFLLDDEDRKLIRDALKRYLHYLNFTGRDYREYSLRPKIRALMREFDDANNK